MIATVNGMYGRNAPVSRLTSFGDFSVERSTWNGDSLSSGKSATGGVRLTSVKPRCERAAGANRERLILRKQQARRRNHE